MKKIIVIFVVLSCLAIGIYNWIASLPATSFSTDYKILSPEIGEQLFWGRGTCHVCHRIGTRGYALRGPNLGDSKDGALITQRAALRAEELALAGATDYLVQSIMQPARYIVSGYNNEMPEVFNAPVALNPAEIDAIIRYLMSLNGDTTFAKIDLPIQFWNRKSEQEFLVSGEVAEGRHLFFDLKGPAACAACHAAIDSTGGKMGSDFGPDLSVIANIRTAEHLYLKIVNPDSNIVSGYNEVLIRTTQGLLLTGILQGETITSLQLKLKNGDRLTINKEEIEACIPQASSSMPGNYADLLSEAQIHDLVAYLLKQTHTNN